MFAPPAYVTVLGERRDYAAAQLPSQSWRGRLQFPYARVAELADAQDLGSCGETRAGSTPASRIELPAAAAAPARSHSGLLFNGPFGVAAARAVAARRRRTSHPWSTCACWRLTTPRSRSSDDVQPTTADLAASRLAQGMGRDEPGAKCHRAYRVATVRSPAGRPPTICLAVLLQHHRAWHLWPWQGVVQAPCLPADRTSGSTATPPAMPS